MEKLSETLHFTNILTHRKRREDKTNTLQMYQHSGKKDLPMYRKTKR